MKRGVLQKLFSFLFFARKGRNPAHLFIKAHPAPVPRSSTCLNRTFATTMKETTQYIDLTLDDDLDESAKTSRVRFASEIDSNDLPLAKRCRSEVTEKDVKDIENSDESETSSSCEEDDTDGSDAGDDIGDVDDGDADDADATTRHELLLFLLNAEVDPLRLERSHWCDYAKYINAELVASYHPSYLEMVWKARFGPVGDVEERKHKREHDKSAEETEEEREDARIRYEMSF